MALGTFLAGLFGEFAFGVAINLFSNRMDGPLVERFTAGKRLQNHDLERAVHLAYIQAQEHVCQVCLTQATTPIIQFWLRDKQQALAAERQGLKGSTPPQAPMTEIEDVALLVTPRRPEVQAAHDDLAARLVAAAADARGTPEVYRKRLEEQLYRQMSLHFAVHIKYNPAVNHIFIAEVVSAVAQETEQIKAVVTEMSAWVRRIYERTVQQEPPSFREISVERNAGFVGRGQLLERIRSVLTEQDVVALFGLGGVGKTQLAARYAYERWDDYRCIFWLRAEDDGILSADYASLATKLALPAAALTDREEVMAAVRRWLENTPGWLLVFDNASGPGALTRYLPHSRTGHVLITSRYADWDGMVEQLPVPPFEPGESVTFLEQRTRQTEHEAAHSLADELGHLPLALAQAGAYVANSPLITVADYLALYRERHQGILNEQKANRSYPDTVATTWSLSFRAVEKQAPEATDLLCLCAFLAPDQIPMELLTVVKDREKLNRLVGVLCQYSLMQAHRQERTLSVHRLVQEVVRDQLGEAGRQRWARAAEETVNEAFPADAEDPANWPRCARLLSHAEAALAHFAFWELEADCSSQLRTRVGTYLREMGSFKRAAEHLGRALTIRERTLTPDHLDIAAAHNHMGLILQSLGDYGEALRHVELALEIRKRVLGPEHLDVAQAHNSVGGVLVSLGHHEKALEHIEQAQTIWERVLIPDHPDMATAYNNVGMALKHLGRDEQALAFLERGLSTLERIHAPDHPRLAIAHNNVGLILKELESYDEALKHLQRSMAIKERVLSPDHPHTATAHFNVGILLHSLERRSEALEHLEQALAIRQRVFPPDHPLVVKTLWNVIMVLTALGRREEAQQRLDQAARRAGSQD